VGPATPLEWLGLVEHELLLFASVFFLLGALDELAVDFAWLWLLLTGRGRSQIVDRRALRDSPLNGPAAILIPAWHEDRVIEFTVAHAIAAWPHDDLRLYVGCYRNDPATFEAATRGASGDPRVRVVAIERDGPTTKADCLNLLYAALEEDERRSGRPFRLVGLHDAEDMVDPAALGLLDQAVETFDFVQLPVLPEPQPSSRWVGSHYCEEFAEQHAKTLVVREAQSGALPAAGVGCAFSRQILVRIAESAGGAGPFSVESLTEDYELGLRVKAFGGHSRFLRARGEDGQLVATRACFPATLDQAVRQKSRWVHGIALQGWDRLGWSGSPGEWWMLLRDRRGPFNALVLFVGYLVLIGGAVLIVADSLGVARVWKPDAGLEALIALNFLALGWRAAVRFVFTTREYGWREGLRALARLPLSNIVAIMAGRRALFAYVRTLGGAPPRWDKTFHDAHPAAMARQARAA